VILVDPNNVKAVEENEAKQAAKSHNKPHGHLSKHKHSTPQSTTAQRNYLKAENSFESFYIYKFSNFKSCYL
jgi:hypothetical protein